MTQRLQRGCDGYPTKTTDITHDNSFVDSVALAAVLRFLVCDHDHL